MSPRHTQKMKPRATRGGVDDDDDDLVSMQCRCVIRPVRGPPASQALVSRYRYMENDGRGRGEKRFQPRTTLHTCARTSHGSSCAPARRSADPPLGGRWPPGPQLGANLVSEEDDGDDQTTGDHGEGGERRSGEG